MTDTVIKWTTIWMYISKLYGGHFCQYVITFHQRREQTMLLSSSCYRLICAAVYLPSHRLWWSQRWFQETTHLLHEQQPGQRTGRVTPPTRAAQANNLSSSLSRCTGFPSPTRETSGPQRNLSCWNGHFYAWALVFGDGQTRGRQCSFGHVTVFRSIITSTC